MNFAAARLPRRYVANSLVCLDWTKASCEDTSSCAAGVVRLEIFRFMVSQVFPVRIITSGFVRNVLTCYALSGQLHYCKMLQVIAARDIQHSERRNRMDKKPVSVRGFRPKGETLAMIEAAERMEIPIAELVNQVLDAHLKPYFDAAVRERRKELKKMLEVAAV